MSLHNLEAEQALLGAALFDNATVARARLDAADFYDPVHADLWREITQAYRGGRLVDALRLRGWAQKRCPEIGGGEYLARLIEAAALIVPQACAYAELIHDLAQRRATVAAARAAIAEAEGGGADAQSVRGALEQRLQEIAQNDADADAWERLGDLAMEAVERAELGETRGISTGIPRLDEVTGGLVAGTLWVAGGATSMGKSILGAYLTRAIAGQGFGVGDVHLEMDRTQIGLRTASAMAFQNDHRADNPAYLNAQRGDLREHEWAALRGAAKASTALPVYTDARPNRTISQIEAGARRLFQRMRRDGVKPGALVIDHEGLIAPEPGARFGSQLEATNARSNALLAMAKRLDVAVIALSQITKEGSRADGEDRMPCVHDLNYGSALSQAASVVILLHRPAYYEERKPGHLRDVHKLRNREATLVVDKTRGGQRAHVKVLMDPATAAVWAA